MLKDNLDIRGSSLSSFTIRVQFFSKKGYLKDVKGYINSNTLMNDLFSSFHLSDSNKIETLLELKKELLIHPARSRIGFFGQIKLP